MGEKLRASPSVARISRETVDGSDIGSRISAEGPMVTVLSRSKAEYGIYWVYNSYILEWVYKGNIVGIEC